LALGLCVATSGGLVARFHAAPAALGPVGLLLQVALSAIVIYATFVEPFRLVVTRVKLDTDKLPAGRRVRLVHLSDLHVERITRREQELIERVNALSADYVLLTGDYLNFSYVGEPRAIADARKVLGSLRASEGVYAVRGTHQVDPNAVMRALLDGLPIRWLRNECHIVKQDGYQIAFAGASCTRRRDIDLPALRQALAGVPEDSYAVLLYHSPELVPDAVAGGVDLYLAGHTHGGQLRLPLYGALFTATDVGKRYEMGRYQMQGLTLYVSRGLGMEGMAAPRARFLCPPEIVCIDLVGSSCTWDKPQGALPA
jgi:predicted MPP superfamily phosphohydrolase